MVGKLENPQLNRLKVKVAEELNSRKIYSIQPQDINIIQKNNGELEVDITGREKITVSLDDGKVDIAKLRDKIIEKYNKLQAQQKETASKDSKLFGLEGQTSTKTQGEKNKKALNPQAAQVNESAEQQTLVSATTKPAAITPGLRNAAIEAVIMRPSELKASYVSAEEAHRRGKTAAFNNGEEGATKKSEFSDASQDVFDQPRSAPPRDKNAQGTIIHQHFHVTFINGDQYNTNHNTTNSAPTFQSPEGEENKKKDTKIISNSAVPQVITRAVSPTYSAQADYDIYAFMKQHLLENRERQAVIKRLWEIYDQKEALKEVLENPKLKDKEKAKYQEQLQTLLKEFNAGFDQLEEIEAKVYKDLQDLDTFKKCEPQRVRDNVYSIGDINNPSAQFELDDRGILKDVPAVARGKHPIDIAMDFKTASGKVFDGGKLYLHYDNNGKLTDFDVPGPIYTEVVAKDGTKYKKYLDLREDINNLKKLPEYGNNPLFIERNGERYNLPVNFEKFRDLYNTSERFMGQKHQRNANLSKQRFLATQQANEVDAHLQQSQANAPEMPRTFAYNSHAPQGQRFEEITHRQAAAAQAMPMFPVTSSNKYHFISKVNKDGQIQLYVSVNGSKPVPLNRNSTSYITIGQDGKPLVSNQPPINYRAEVQQDQEQPNVEQGQRQSAGATTSAPAVNRKAAGAVPTKAEASNSKIAPETVVDSPTESNPVKSENSKKEIGRIEKERIQNLEDLLRKGKNNSEIQTGKPADVPIAPEASSKVAGHNVQNADVNQSSEKAKSNRILTALKAGGRKLQHFGEEVKEKAASIGEGIKAKAVSLGEAIKKNSAKNTKEVQYSTKQEEKKPEANLEGGEVNTSKASLMLDDIKKISDDIRIIGMTNKNDMLGKLIEKFDADLSRLEKDKNSMGNTRYEYFKTLVEDRLASAKKILDLSQKVDDFFKSSKIAPREVVIDEILKPVRRVEGVLKGVQNKSGEHVEDLYSIVHDAMKQASKYISLLEEIAAPDKQKYLSRDDVKKTLFDNKQALFLKDIEENIENEEHKAGVELGLEMRRNIVALKNKKDELIEQVAEIEPKVIIQISNEKLVDMLGHKGGEDTSPEAGDPVFKKHYVEIPQNSAPTPGSSSAPSVPNAGDAPKPDNPVYTKLPISLTGGEGKKPNSSVSGNIIAAAPGAGDSVSAKPDQANSSSPYGDSATMPLKDFKIGNPSSPDNGIPAQASESQSAELSSETTHTKPGSKGYGKITPAKPTSGVEVSDANLEAGSEHSGASTVPTKPGSKDYGKIPEPDINLIHNSGHYKSIPQVVDGSSQNAKPSASASATSSGAPSAGSEVTTVIETLKKNNIGVKSSSPISKSSLPIGNDPNISKGRGKSG